MKGSVCLVTQLCLTLCDPMDCSLPGSSVHRDSPGKNTGLGCHSFQRGIFPTQGSNPGLLHCKWIFYQLSYTIKIQFSYVFSTYIFFLNTVDLSPIVCQLQVYYTVIQWFYRLHSIFSYYKVMIIFLCTVYLCCLLFYTQYFGTS